MCQDAGAPGHSPLPFTLPSHPKSDGINHATPYHEFEACSTERECMPGLGNLNSEMHTSSERVIASDQSLADLR